MMEQSIREQLIREQSIREQSIREQLNELAEEKYRIFTSALTPGKENILGVRIPILKKMGVKIIKGDWRTYLEQAKDDTMEEVMLQGMVIGGCNVDIEGSLGWQRILYRRLIAGQCVTVSVAD